MIKRFVDIAIAVRDLDSAIRVYSAVLGTSPRRLGTADYAYPGLEGARFYLENAAISLVASSEPQSPVTRFLDRKGEGVNHISLEVDKLNKEAGEMAARGIKLLTDEPLDFPEGRVIFAHPASLHGVQVAFVESKPGLDLLRPPGAR